MYGTVARFRAKPGMMDALRDLGARYAASPPPGYVTQYLYQMDDDPNEFFMAVLFESREAYMANADSAEQHERYLEMRELLEADPEWHDGVVAYPID